MPELAEVEFYRKQWNPGIGQKAGQVLTHPKARIYREAPATRARHLLSGRKLMESAAHGKKLCFRFSGNVWLGLHLGMSGKLQAERNHRKPGRHEHLVLQMDAVSLIFSDYRMFGKVQLHQGSGAPSWWSELPPQPQDPAFTRKRFKTILEKHPRRPLKALLLEQDSFPGIGNWMADEILWRAGIHPRHRATELSAYSQTKVYKALKEVSQDAMRVIGPDWGTPPDTWLFNHRWKRGGTCPRTGKPLEWITVGGRSTCFSPARQR